MQQLSNHYQIDSPDYIFYYIGFAIIKNEIAGLSNIEKKLPQLFLGSALTGYITNSPLFGEFFYRRNSYYA